MVPLDLPRKFGNCLVTHNMGLVLDKATANCDILGTAKIHPAEMSSTVGTMAGTVHDGSMQEHQAALEWAALDYLINGTGLECHKVHLLPSLCSGVAAAAEEPCLVSLSFSILLFYFGTIPGKQMHHIHYTVKEISSKKSRSSIPQLKFRSQVFS